MVCSFSQGRKKHGTSARFLQSKGTHGRNCTVPSALLRNEFELRPQPDFKPLSPPAHSHLNHYKMLMGIHS